MRWALGLLLACLLAGPVGAYTEGIVGLSFQEPKGWNAAHADGEQRFEVHPTDPEGWALITLRTTELGDVEELSRDQVLEITRRLAADLHDFNLMGSKSIHLGGVPAHLLSYTATSGKIHLQTTQVFTVRTGRLVLLGLTTSTQSHKARRLIFDQLLKTVKWSDPR